MRRLSTWTCVLSIPLAGACSGLGPMAPRGGLTDPAALDEQNAIAYRTLTRADFQAAEPPADASPYAKRIGALTCAHIRTTPATSYEVRQLDATRFEARFQQLGFRALMDRNCSWWNPQSNAFSESYVLQHEQIHFALTEIGARRLDARSPRVVREFVVVADEQKKAEEGVRAELQRIISQALEELLEVNTQFDEDTSAKYAPEVQAQWWRRVERELAETAR